MTDAVSIIIPAYNATATIEATILSAMGQTHPDIEILVVDDGSTDDSVALVRQLTAGDARVRILRQQNGGVARARNHGIEAAKGDYIAPLDADDIWHPEKIARQVAALSAAPRDVALAYNWFRRIDAEGMVLPGSPSPAVEGYVFHRHLDWNFISNGSTPLIRAEVARAVRFDPALHDAGNQGCEDYLVQLTIARHWKFLCVPAYLTGYRRTPGAMSTDVARMLRSHMQMFALVAEGAGPAAQAIVRGQQARLRVELARSQLRHAAPGEAVGQLRQALATDWLVATRTLAREALARLRKDGAKAGAQGTLRPFASYAADEADGGWQTHRSRNRQERLARLDAGHAARDVRSGIESVTVEP